MKKFISLLFAIVLSFSISSPAFANEIHSSTKTEQLSVSSALSNPEISNFLNETGEMDELAAIQTELKASLDMDIAKEANATLNVSEISENDIQEISIKYGLTSPLEDENGTIDNGTINVTRDSVGRIIDVWYIYYPYNDAFFSICAALVDDDNPLDSITGTVSYYYLNNKDWKKKENDRSFKATSVRNGVIFKWLAVKWGVKEKFEYNITVVDNGFNNKYNNIGEDNYTRYNFEAKPYSDFTANGGQRHHFIPSTSLSRNGFNSNAAYCIRMMTADHQRTGSYGNSSHVSDITSLLSNKQYVEALRYEVADMQSHYDSEGTGKTLENKYYNQIVICLMQYEYFFGIRQ